MFTDYELSDIEFLINEKLLKLSKNKYPNIRLTDAERETVALENRLKQLLEKVRKKENKCNEKHTCHCGTSSVEGGHEVGTHGCVRRLTEAPKPTGEDSLQWDVNGTKITDFTLRQQRGYSQQSCGCWTKAPSSSNSLEGEW